MALTFDALINHKHKKHESTWFKWALKILQRRGHPAPPSCASGFQQIVSETFPIGKGSAFFSMACGGCSFGERVIRDYYKMSPARQAEFRKSFGSHCAFLKAPFVTEKEVKVGDVITVQL